MTRALLLSLALWCGTCALFTVASPHVDLTAPNLRAARRTARHAPQEIEYRWDPDGSLSLLVQTPARSDRQSELFLFPAAATAQEVAQSKLIEAIMHQCHAKGRKVQCTFQDEAGHALDASTELGPLLSTRAASLHLVCRSSSRRSHGHHARPAERTFTFRSHTPPRLAPNEVRAKNVLRRVLTGEEAEYPLTAAEMLSETWQGLVGWAESFAKYHWGELHAFPDYTTSTTQTGRWHLNTGAVLQRESTFGPESDEPVRIAIAADWAAGTLEADYCQQVMMKSNGSAFEPHWTLHVGDIYYVGAPEYVQSNCLGVAPSGVKRGVTWPHGSLGSFAVEGNHEMYARAIGFFDTFLPTLGVTNPSTGAPSGQEAGFVSMENAYWRVIMLDTGYGTYNWIPKNDNRNNTQPQSVIDWLINEVNITNPDDTRGIIFLTHHQAESAFEAPWQATPNQIAEIMPPNRTVIWLFGHEHRLAFYKMFTLPNATNPMSLYSRCIGNGGFPASVSPIPQRAAESGLMAYDDRLYTLETGFFGNTSVSYNGFVHLTLDKNSASLVYSSLTTDSSTGELSSTLRTELVHELFEVDTEGNVYMSSFAILDPEMTVINGN